mgnify:CR=1 FL=1
MPVATLDDLHRLLTFGIERLPDGILVAVQLAPGDQPLGLLSLHRIALLQHLVEDAAAVHGEVGAAEQQTVRGADVRSADLLTVGGQDGVLQPGPQRRAAEDRGVLVTIATGRELAIMYEMRSSG